MSIKKAKALGVEVTKAGTESEFIERWTSGNTRLEIRSSKSAEFPVSSSCEHYVRKVSIENGQVIWVSEMYASRSSARRAALKEFEGRVPSDSLEE